MRKKIISKVAAAVIAIVYGVGEIPEVWLGMEEMLKAYGNINEEEASQIGLIVALTVGSIAAGQVGVIVFFHAVKQLQSYLQRGNQAHSHHHDTDSDCDHSPSQQTLSSREKAKKILAYTIMSMGMLIQFGLSAAAWDKVLTHNITKLSLGWRIAVPVSLALGRSIGSYLFHGHHTYKHLASPSTHKSALTQTSTNCTSRILLALTKFLYLTLWLGHAGQANFEVVETREYVLGLANQTNALENNIATYWSVRSFELFIAAIVGLQLAYVEGGHIEELKATLHKFWPLSIKEKVVSGGSAVIGAFAHTLPEVVGLMMIASEMKVSFSAMVGLIVSLGMIELFIASALHLPYNIKVASSLCGTKVAFYQHEVSAIDDNDVEKDNYSLVSKDAPPNYSTI